MKEKKQSWPFLSEGFEKLGRNLAEETEMRLKAMLEPPAYQQGIRGLGELAPAPGSVLSRALKHQTEEEKKRPDVFTLDDIDARLQEDADNANAETAERLADELQEQLPATESRRTPTAAELRQMQQYAIAYKKKHKKASEREVRRAVQRKFNLTIVGPDDKL